MPSEKTKKAFKQSHGYKIVVKIILSYRLSLDIVFDRAKNKKIV